MLSSVLDCGLGYNRIKQDPEGTDGWGTQDLATRKGQSRLAPPHVEWDGYPRALARPRILSQGEWKQELEPADNLGWQASQAVDV